jgi:hypothetical protein
VPLGGYAGQHPGLFILELYFLDVFIKHFVIAQYNPGKKNYVPKKISLRKSTFAKT